MKTRIATFFCTALVSLTALGQTPTPPLPPPGAPVIATPAAAPVVTPAATAAPVVATTPFATATPLATATPGNSVTVTVSSSSTPSADDAIDNMIEKKINRHFSFTTGHNRSHDYDLDDSASWIAPMVSVIVLTVFGMPVLIVAVILYFSFSKNRAMHKTVRMMVEKGQPVPEAILNPPPVIRQRSDLRRGIKWMLWGVGLIIFFGACNDWDGGAWSLGIIPFMIGVGYFIFWRLDLRDQPALPPTAQPPPPPSSPAV